MSALALSKLTKRPPMDSTKKPKKKLDRFDGLTEEEVQKYTLEDILEPDLDLVFVGINPSLMAAHRGRYYAGPGNHFYKLLHESGLVPKFVSFEEDRKLLNYKIGLTNIVARATRSSADLKKSEIKEGSAIVREKLRIFKPKIAVFNGKCIYDVFADKTGKSDFYFGLQPEKVDQTTIWVVPSSSARCAQYPRMVDKLHFYSALKKYLSFLKGEISEINKSEYRFEGKCRQPVATTSRMWRRKSVSAFLHGGRVANKETVCLDTSDENIDIVKSRDFIITEILSQSDDNEEFSFESVTPDRIAYSEEQTQSLETKTSLETKNESNIHPDSTSFSSAEMDKRMSEQPLKSPSRAFKSRNDDNSTNFIDLIKKRLSEKRDRTDREEGMAQDCSKAVKEGKRLKFANLKVNTKNNS